MAKSKGQLPFRSIIAGFFVAYLGLLALFVFFPRPILETGDPSAVSAFLQDHANLFYKILYADTQSVEIANYFMLTPFVLMAHFYSPKTTLWKIGLVAALLSMAIELSQRFIPGRVSDFRDFYSNFLSALIGLALIRFLQPLSKR